MTATTTTGSGGPPAAPTVVSVTAQPPTSTVRNGYVTVYVSGQTSQLRWRLPGIGHEVTSSPSQNTIILPPSPRPWSIGVQAIGPGGASHILTSPSVRVPFPASPTRMKRVILSRPVFVLGPQAGAKKLVSSVGQARPTCVGNMRIAAEDGLLDVQGCIFPVTALQSLTGPTTGIVEDMARQYGLTLNRYNVNLALVRSDAYAAVGHVSVNGLGIDPAPNSAVVIFPQVHRIAASNAALAMSQLKLGHPPRFELDTTPHGGQIPFPQMPIIGGGDGPLEKFKFFGDVKINAVPGGATVTANLELPPFLRWAAGPATASVTMRATTDSGLSLDALRVGPLSAQIGPIQVNDFQITYTGGSDQLWKGQADFCLVPFSKACLSALPKYGGGIEVRHGNLTFGGASIRFPAPIPLFPGLDMERIGFGLGTDPLRFIASTDLVALRLVDIKPGAAVIALPTSGSPYNLAQNRQQLPGFPEKLYAQQYTGPTVGVVGNFGLRVPFVGSVGLGSAYFLYEFPGYVAFGGGIGYSFLGIVSFNAGVAGEVNFSNGRFNLHGRGEGCVIGVVCTGAIGDISQKGLGICVIPVGSIEHPIVSMGVMVDFATGDVQPRANGCRWSKYAEFNVHGSRDGADSGTRARMSGASLPLTVTIRRGDRSRSILLRGAGAAPAVRVTAPDGSALDTRPKSGLALGPGAKLRILRVDRIAATAVGLQDPRPGRYTIAALPGSAAVSRIEATTDPEPVQIRGRVSGRGTTRILRYDVRRRPDQTVTFMEVAGEARRVIGTVNGGGRGTLRFSPVPGRAGRAIEAQTELAGIPAELVTVAHFRPPSPQLPRVPALRARHTGTRVRVSWARVTGATAYEVAVSSSGDAQRRLRVRGNSITIGVAQASSGRVTVQALGYLRAGNPAFARFAASSKPSIRFRPLPLVPRLK